jgi:cell division protein FtsN
MQDYKHIRYESEKRKTETKRSKKTSWLILILLTTLIVAGVYLQKHPVVAQKIEKIVEEHKPVKDPIPAKRFTFYDILARGEVIVSADIPVEIKQNKIYIQLGAFRSDADADNFEAKMTLLGLRPQVQSLDIPEKGGHWFIVRIGPVKDDNELGMIKTLLTQNNIEFGVVAKSN